MARAQEKKSTRLDRPQHKTLLSTANANAAHARISHLRPLSLAGAARANAAEETAATAMPHHRHQGAALDEAPSPRPSAAGCYAFLTRSHRAAGGYRRLDSADSARALDDEAAAAAAAVVRVEVGTTRGRAKSVFHVDPAVLEAGPVRRLLAAAGRRAPGGGVAVAVDALLFEHLLWLATKAAAGGGEGVGGDDDSAAADDLSEIVEFYSQDDDGDDDHNHGF